MRGTRSLGIQDVEIISGGQDDRSDLFEYPLIQILACVMLFYAAEGGGIIIVSASLGLTSYVAGKNPFNVSNEPRELAKWEAAVDQLLDSGYIKYVGREDRVYKVTEKGYIMSDNFKTDNKLDVCMNSSQILEMFK